LVLKGHGLIPAAKIFIEPFGGAKPEPLGWGVEGLTLKRTKEGKIREEATSQSRWRSGPKVLCSLQFLSHFGNDIASGWKDCDVRLGHLCRDPIDGFLNIGSI
jgi:hypothetical protein